MSEWKLVPVEPTEDMVVSGFESWPDRYFSKPEDWLAFEAMSGCQQAAHKARLCYAAMLAAAPADIPVHVMQGAEAVDELSNIANAERFDREIFANDTEFADWVQSRARHTWAKIKEQK